MSLTGTRHLSISTPMGRRAADLDGDVATGTAKTTVSPALKIVGHRAR